MILFKNIIKLYLYSVALTVRVLLVNAFPPESRKSYNMMSVLNLFFLDVDLSDEDGNQPYDYKFVRWMIKSKVRYPSCTLFLEMLF